MFGFENAADCCGTVQYGPLTTIFCAELIDGEDLVTGHPWPLHGAVGQSLLMLLKPFARTGTRSTGWWLHDDGEVNLLPERQELAPDLVGWRRARLRKSIEEDLAGIEVVPDWIGEALSPETTELTRDRKLPIYARHGVPWVWLIDLEQRSLEIHQLENGSYLPPRVFSGAAKVRAAPFDAVELDLARLWNEAEQRGGSVR